MNLSGPFIRRPVMTSLVMGAIALFGAMAYRNLPVSDLPTVDFPTIQVSAALPGASPETMASAVATVLERQFSTIAGLDSMSSTSSLGSTLITLQFNLSRPLDSAALDVQAAITQAGGQLPPDMPHPPFYQKVNPADQPILYLALTSKTLPMYQLDEYGETTMAQRISTVNGVAQVQVFGSQKFAVRVQLDPRELAYRKLGIDEVSAAVQAANVNLPTGVLYGVYNAFTIQTAGQLVDASQYRPLVIAYRNGAPVQLSQVGRVIDSVENDKTAAWYVSKTDLQRSVILAIQRQPGTNTVEVTDAVNKILPSLRQQIPASVSINVLYDRSVAIRNSVQDVEFTLVLALALVVMVIFLFLRNLTATIIPSLTLPMAIVGTFAVMYLLGYSLDNLSLMALTLSVGFVVDDAVVMLENIFRHMEMGKPARQAALEGSSEIGFTIISMTLSLTAVFIPVLFMGGLLGRLFREFAVTIGMAVLISGFIALTLTPMMSSLMLHRMGEAAQGGQKRHGRIIRTARGALDWSVAFYDRTLRIVLRYRLVTILISLAILILSFALFVIIPKGFLPNEDRDLLFAFTEAPEGISYDSMVEHQLALTRVVQADPNVESLMSSMGARQGLSASNSGVMFIRLIPRSQRKLSADEVAQELRPKLAQVQGISAYLQNLPPIPIGGRLTKSQYQYTLTSPSTEELYRYATLLLEQLRKARELQDVTSDMQIHNPQVNITINRNMAQTYGVTAHQIEDALYDAYGARQISTIYTASNQYQVIIELEPGYQLDPQVLSLLYIRSSNSTTAAPQLVPLSGIVRMDVGQGPLTVNHTGQLPSVTLSFNTAPGAALGDAVAQVNAASGRLLPATIVTSFQGTAQVFESSIKGLLALLVLAVVVIYLVLGILYESFIHPLTILSALPFAGFGALLTLLVFGEELSIYAFVGLIMLVGLVKKNGIIMIDFALDAQRREGLSADDAIHRACMVRFRPIMMTSFAALMASLPIAFGIGAGAESRRPLGLAVVGGLLFSQTLTLYVTPVIFVYFEHFRRRLGGSAQTPAAQA